MSYNIGSIEGRRLRRVSISDCTSMILLKGVTCLGLRWVCMFAIIRLPASYRPWSIGDDGDHCILCVGVFSFLACSGACGVGSAWLVLGGGVFIPDVGAIALGAMVGGRYSGGRVGSDAL